MKAGDLVVAKYDMERGLHCVGIVLIVDLKDSSMPSAKVAWCSNSNPVGWWNLDKLELWHESR